MAEFASSAVGGTGLGLGIAGTALGLMNGGLGNIFGGGTNRTIDSAVAGLTASIPSMINADDKHVTRHELDLIKENMAKDATIADLKSEQYTDKKLVEVYAEVTKQVNGLRDEVRANKDEQNAVNTAQAVYNGTNTATVASIQSQVAALQSVFKIVMPNSSVCPGWGNVTITPATAG